MGVIFKDSESAMARVCEVSGKRGMVGHKVSHSNRKTKKVTQPNLQRKRFWVPSEGRYVRLKVSTSAIRDIDKRGIEAVLREMKSK